MGRGDCAGTSTASHSGCLFRKLQERVGPERTTFRTSRIPCSNFELTSPRHLTVAGGAPTAEMLTPAKMRTRTRSLFVGSHVIISPPLAETSSFKSKTRARAA